MNQSELVEKVAQKTTLTQAAATEAVKAVVQAILASLVAGEPVRVSGRCRRDLCWNLIGAVSDRMRIRGQAARSIGLSASFWVRLCHPSTLRIVI